jgi:hypothetical protein
MDPGDWISQILGLALGAVLFVGGPVLLLRHWLGGPERERQQLEREMLARDRGRHAAEQQWVDAGELPLTDHDVYLTVWEFTQDLARMKALGYDLEWQEHLDDGTIAATYVLTPAYQRKAAPMS